MAIVSVLKFVRIFTNGIFDRNFRKGALMKDSERLQSAFKRVRKKYFPRWDKDVKWRCELKPDLLLLGKCDRKTKTIFLREVLDNQVELHWILIHEICHAVTIQGHYKTYRKRMRKAAEKAKKFNQPALADRIKNDIERIKISHEVTKKIIHGKIYDFKVENPDLSYVYILEYVAADFSMYPNEVEENYPGCRKTFDKAAKDTQAEKERYKRFKAQFKA